MASIGSNLRALDKENASNNADETRNKKVEVCRQVGTDVYYFRSLACRRLDTRAAWSAAAAFTEYWLGVPASAGETRVEYGIGRVDLRCFSE